MVEVGSHICGSDIKRPSWRSQIGRNARFKLRTYSWMDRLQAEANEETKKHRYAIRIAKIDAEKPKVKQK
jgi:hypothetical protein